MKPWMFVALAAPVLILGAGVAAISLQQSSHPQDSAVSAQRVSGAGEAGKTQAVFAAGVEQSAPPAASPPAPPTQAAAPTSAVSPKQAQAHTSVDPLLDPNWLEGAPVHRAQVDPMMGQAAPPLQVDSWLNTPSPLTWDKLKGKTVVVFFWSPRCHTCQRIMPALNQMYRQLAGKTFEMIGVCVSSQAPIYASGVQQHGIPFPTALDQNNATWNAYGADGTPDFFVIDKNGVMRVADAKNTMAIQAAATYMGLVKKGKAAAGK